MELPPPNGGGRPPLRRGTDEQTSIVPRVEPPEPDGPEAGSGRRAPLSRAPLSRAPLSQQARRARLITLVVVAVALLGVLPAALLLRDTGKDPVLTAMDSLSVPGWASEQHEDVATGNRWCIDTCRLRERTWRSAKPAKETDPAYQQALVQSGWLPWHTAGCPTGTAGVYSCWQRDQYVLDLWTRDAPCDLSNVAPAPSAGTPSGAPPSGTAGAGPSAVPIPTPTGSEPPSTCSGSLVTVKVSEKVDPHWHK
jgi:hypothetical protein